MKLLPNILVLLPLVLCAPTHQQDHIEGTHSVASASQDDTNREPQANRDFVPKYDIKSAAPLPSSIHPPLNNHTRSAMLIVPPPWRTCPANSLKCQKCPRDPRCRHPTLTAHKAKKNTKKTKNPWSLQPMEFGALTGQQIHNMEEGMAQAQADAKEEADCTLAKCDVEGNDCGLHASCLNGYCACPRGRKGETGYAARGWNFPEKTHVYVDPGVACSVSCRNFFCSEIERLEGCFAGANEWPGRSGGQGAHSEGEATGSEGSSEQGHLDHELGITLDQSPGHGAIHFPGAAMEEAVGPVAGLAGTGSTAERV
ncbi:hypothetical protein BDV95DRAFT_608689 [Massariosphaeria phaeospora]|uniref:Uncharacterized protein n=1 Tax=Massariosphaeria phaeospora TaxID=100035 RepID=A0A7C8I727_9PLEO|nr:hypothetical protein BDV95DRAFT_608689 [Massariosphaeria phaeospora]